MSADAYLLTITDEPRRHFGDDAAAFVLAREVVNVQVVARFTLDGEPVSKSRARFTRRGSKVHTYTPEKTKEGERRTAQAFREAAPGFEVDATGAFGVMCKFFNATRQRRDVDNMIKLICDGLNEVAWADDNQVAEVAGRKQFVLEHDEARTEVLIYRIGEVERPSSPCQNCGKPMDIYRSTKGKRKFCNQACHLEWRRSKRERSCAECGDVIDDPRRSHGEPYCSEACYAAKRARENRISARCAECGAEMTVWKSMGNRKNVWCSETCRARRQERRALECVHGHPWETFGHVKSNGRRYCRECARLRAAANAAAKKVSS